MVFHWSLSDSKSPQVSRTLLSILAALYNVVVWMVSTRPPTSKSSSPFSNPLVTTPNAPITIGIIVACMFHSFFNSLARSRYLSCFSHSFSFILRSAGTAKSTIWQVLFLFFFFFFFFFFCGLLLGLVFWPRLGDLCVCQSPIGVYMCYFQGQIVIVIIIKFKYRLKVKGKWHNLIADSWTIRILELISCRAASYKHTVKTSMEVITLTSLNSLWYKKNYLISLKSYLWRTLSSMSNHILFIESVLAYVLIP